MHNIVCDIRKNGDWREVVGIRKALLRPSKNVLKSA